jgi:hypothetical protein
MTATEVIAIVVILLMQETYIVAGRIAMRNEQRRMFLRWSVYSNLSHIAPGAVAGTDLVQFITLHCVDRDGNYYTDDIEPYVQEWLDAKGLS